MRKNLMNELIYKIPNKLTIEWNADVKAVIDTWTNYGITLEQFNDAIINTAVVYASKKGVRAWIADSSKATGVFSQEIQTFINTTIFPKYAKIGVKYFITITSKISSLTKLTVKSYSAKVGPCGLKLVTIDSLEDAIEWLKYN